MPETPEVNLAQERLEWQSGTRMESVSPYRPIEQTIYDPVITEDPLVLGVFLWDAEITEILCYLDGSSTPSVTFTLKYGTDIAAAGTEVVTGGTTVTSTTVTSVVAFNNHVIDAGSILWLEVTAKSGTVQSMQVIVKHRTRP